MTVFRYDKSWEGLLTAVFDAYARRQFPERLLADGEPLPLFCDEAVTICTDPAKADRVWKGLQKAAFADGVVNAYGRMAFRTAGD